MQNRNNTMFPDIDKTPKSDAESILPEAAISGVGIISPIGCDEKSILESLRSGRDGIAQAKKIDVSAFASKLCAEVDAFDCSLHMTKRELSEYTDPFLRLAINAARMALKDAGDDLPKGEKFGMVLASCNAGLASREAEYIKKYADPAARFDMSVCAQSEFYALAKVLAKCLNITGECWMINTACSGSTAAIGLAQSLIESGRCEAVIAGGADAMVLSNYAGFNALKVVSSEKIAPFSTPIGMNIGEGAAFWVLEPMSKVSAKSGKCYGKVIGHSSSLDAHHPTQPDPRGDGAYRAMLEALRDSGLKVSDIACINAHGSGTAANDKAEALAVARLCAGGEKIHVTSTKSYTAHCMGATGIIEATCQLFAMNANFIPPTLRFSNPRAGCANISVAKEAINIDYPCFLSANYAFAGSNAAIVVSKPDFISKPKTKREKKKIVISGIGGISSLGLDIETQLRRLMNGDIGIEKISRFASDRFAGMVDLPPLRSLDRRLDFAGMNLISIYATLAAKAAIDSASLQIRRENCDRIGMALAVCRGSDESAHMKAVFANPDMRGDINSFSNITANSTTGWVSKALEIKGANTTLTSGLDSGIQAAEYAYNLVLEGRSDACIAVSSDELYAQELEAYEKVGFLYTGESERDFGPRFDDDFRSVMGEGAAALLIESEESAAKRGAKIYARLLSCASTIDSCDFLSPGIECDGLERAAKIALKRADLSPFDIDLILWAPKGNRQDEKTLRLLRGIFPEKPSFCSSFQTGNIETGATLLNLVFALGALSRGEKLWKQKKAMMESPALFDFKHADDAKILCLSSSRSANNHALILSLPARTNSFIGPQH